MIEYRCASCEAEIPAEYIERPKALRSVVGNMNFSGHGATTFYWSLYATLYELSEIWQGFYSHAIDEMSLQNIRDSGGILERRELPESTATNRNAPTILRFVNLPSGKREGFLIFYDLSGAAYHQLAAGELMGRVKSAMYGRTLLLMADLTNPDSQYLHYLISAYAQALYRNGFRTYDQHLVVVLTKGDRLKDLLASYAGIVQYLDSGSVESLKGQKLDNYLREMQIISRHIREFMVSSGKAAAFVNLVESKFKSVQFTIVSALGSEPDNGRLQEKIRPKRVIDPLLWILSNS